MRHTMAVSAYTVAGYRIALFVVTVIGIFALFAVLQDVTVGLLISGVVLAGCLSLILGLRRRVGHGSAAERR